MDVKYINPFLNGTLEVLKTMAFMDARPGKVYLKESNVAAGDVSGIIGVTGDAIGSLAISFTEPCICNIVGRMLGETHATADKEVFDAVGEITNMISGVARTYLEKQGMTVYAAIPTVIYGKNHTIDPVLPDSPSIIIPFSTENGDFVVDVCIKTTEADARKAEDYQVLNRKTQVPQSKAAVPGFPPGMFEAPPVKVKKNTPPLEKSAAPPQAEAKDIPPPLKPDATPEDRKEYLKNKLKEFTAARDTLIKQLAEKPFMEISKRTLFKKQIPQYDAKIKRLMLDIRAIEMMSSIDKDRLDNPVIAPHFQHYGNKNQRN